MCDTARETEKVITVNDEPVNDDTTDDEVVVDIPFDPIAWRNKL